VHAGDAGARLQFFHQLFGAAVFVGFSRQQIGQPELAGPTTVLGRSGGVLLLGGRTVLVAARVVAVAVPTVRVVVTAG